MYCLAVIQNFGKGCFLSDTDIESTFWLLFTMMTGSFPGCSGRGNIILKTSFPSGALTAPYLSNQLSDAIG